MERVKQETFEAIWEKYELVRDALLISGAPENRLPQKSKMQNKLKDWPLEKIQAGHLWIISFIDGPFMAWKRIRKENTEEYWKGTQGWGKNFPEVREMNYRNNELRVAWFDRHNLLVRERRKRNGKDK